jgi:phosphoglycolate phosphatase
MFEPVAIESVIFDFDYTLADSSAGIEECINFALAAMQLPAVAAHAAHRTIGLHLFEAFVVLAGEAQAGRTEEFRLHFALRADQVMNERTVLYDTVPSAVQRLKASGRSLGIVSTKYRSRIEELLRREQVLEGFDAITGGEDVSRHKPDPEGLHQALLRLKAHPERALYVGDSVVDAQAAAAAGIPFAAVLTGVTGPEEFEPFPYVRIFRNLRELTDWVAP